MYGLRGVSHGSLTLSLMDPHKHFITVYNPATDRSRDLLVFAVLF